MIIKINMFMIIKITITITIMIILKLLDFHYIKLGKGVHLLHVDSQHMCTLRGYLLEKYFIKFVGIIRYKIFHLFETQHHEWKRFHWHPRDPSTITFLHFTNVWEICLYPR